ncbi:MAG TPA: alpha-L-fucosidase [Spirochaetia bacterium]|nr:alpha-L-fucosidase [Spirochaetia bacterium]
MKRFGDGRDWFFDKKFGLFVHWGLYAIPAWQEQVLWRAPYKRRDYERLMSEFNPGNFNPDQWLDTMQEAGMEYLCFTTKHHDGFCMWDTKYTEYNVMNTPYGKDVVRQLADACARRGVLFGLYYSLPDWHHPAYPNRGKHHEMLGFRSGERMDEHEYLEFVRNQVRELLTNYGPIHEFFWDVNVEEFSDPTFNEMIRALQPNAVINDRGPSAGDFTTPERQVPEGKEFDHPVQACDSIGRESWGYRTQEDYYSSRYLVRSMDKILAMGGGYLLNVGPKADGSFPVECTERLAKIGSWYHSVRESFDGTYPASYLLTSGQTRLIRYDDVYLTRRDNTVYIHCPDGLQTGAVVLPGISAEPSDVTLLNDGTSLPWSVETLPWRWTEKPCLVIRGVPDDCQLNGIPVIRMKLADVNFE